MKHILPLCLIYMIIMFCQVPQVQGKKFEIAVLQGLDKVTARVSTFRVAVGTTIQFGTLKITVRTCDKRPPEETPESAAFINVYETRPGESTIRVYSGWMFASSPALAAMEHPVYDVWVVDCINNKIDLLKNKK